jgi:hypothetical protein
MRKPLNVLIVGVLALLVAVSCGSGDQSAAEDTDESASAAGSEDARGDQCQKRVRRVSRVSKRVRRRSGAAAI